MEGPAHIERSTERSDYQEALLSHDVQQCDVPFQNDVPRSDCSAAPGVPHCKAHVLARRRATLDTTISCKKEHTLMKRILMAALTAGACALSGFGVISTVHAASIQNDVRIPVSGQVINACNGELVDFTGYFHLSATATSDGAGGFHLDFHDNAQGIKAVGETTGVKYVGSQADHFTLNLTNGAMNATQNGQFQAIAQGTVPNFTVTYLLHITVNANGTITATVDNFNSTCH
jgi:hypothetical protein